MENKTKYITDADMKETKVYVDDETLMKCERYRHNNCPIIQTHDRALVKEVCEKIKVWCENIENWTNDCNHRVLSLDESNEFLKQLQKEFEK